MTEFKIEKLFDPDGKPVCKTRKATCVFLAEMCGNGRSICCYQSKNVHLEARDWVYPHDKCVVHTEEE